MVQPIPTSLVARAAASYLKPALSKTSASAFAGRTAAAIPDRANAPAFVVELSPSAKQHASNIAKDASRLAAQKLTGGHSTRAVDDEILLDGVEETSFELQVDANGRGRREAPLVKSDSPPVYKPAGSIIDVRV